MKKNYHKNTGQKFLLLLSLLLLIPSVFLLANETGAEFLKKEIKDSDARILPYRILLPHNFDTQEKYPLVLFLHGAGERGTDNEKQLIHGSWLFLDQDNRNQFPAIVIFPQCPAEEWWIDTSMLAYLRAGRNIPEDTEFAPSWPMKMVIDLIEDLIKQEIIDQSRMYVMGLSMGGYGTFDILSQRPDWFAAAIPICGGGNSHAVEKYAKNTALWVFHGEKDNVVPVEASRIMVEAIRAAGGNVKYTEYPGVNHNSWDPAFAEPDLLYWLFSHTRQN
ncbi:MAG: phospholipase [Bacteroidetes bacterium]|nr:MAG: phospholipase [Bacteroidota bacterium]